MDNLIKYISNGVGVPKKRKSQKSAVLVRLGSSRRSDALLSSETDSDSSDDDYLPEKKKKAIAKPKTAAKQNGSKKQIAVDTKQKWQKKTTRSVSNVSTASSKVVYQSGESWSRLIPEEMLLKIFRFIMAGNEDWQKALIRMSRVCRLWRRIACDPSLWHTLDLAYGWIVSPVVAMKALAQEGRLAQLQNLNISGCKQVNTACIQFIVDEFSELKSFNISNCLNVNAEGLLLIANGLRQLEHLNTSGINRTPSRSAATLDILKNNQKSLKKLELSSNDWTSNSSELLTTLSTMTMLTMLDISGVLLPSSVLILKTLRQLAPTLGILRMSRCGVKTPQLAAETLEKLQQDLSYPQLIEFTAAETELSSSLPLLCFVKDASQLKHLDVRLWSSDNLGYINDGGELPVFPQLQTLNLRQVSIVKGSEINLSPYGESLEELDVSWMKGPVDEYASFMAPQRNLRALYCAGTPLTMKQLRKILTNCSSIHTMDLESCRSLKRGLKRLHRNRKEINELRKQV